METTSPPTGRPGCRAPARSDPGEELQAMDYLVYAYLQMAAMRSRTSIPRTKQSMPATHLSDLNNCVRRSRPCQFVTQLSEAIGQRCRHRLPPVSAPPPVVAVAIWARALGLASSGTPRKPSRAERLQQIVNRSSHSGPHLLGSQTATCSRDGRGVRPGRGKTCRSSRCQARKQRPGGRLGKKLPVTPGRFSRARTARLFTPRAHPKTTRAGPQGIYRRAQ